MRMEVDDWNVESSLEGPLDEHLMAQLRSDVTNDRLTLLIHETDLSPSRSHRHPRHRAGGTSASKSVSPQSILTIINSNDNNGTREKKRGRSNSESQSQKTRRKQKKKKKQKTVLETEEEEEEEVQVQKVQEGGLKENATVCESVVPDVTRKTNNTDSDAMTPSKKSVTIISPKPSPPASSSLALSATAAISCPAGSTTPENLTSTALTAITPPPICAIDFEPHSQTMLMLSQGLQIALEADDCSSALQLGSTSEQPTPQTSSTQAMYGSDDALRDPSGEVRAITGMLNNHIAQFTTIKEISNSLDMGPHLLSAGASQLDNTPDSDGEATKISTSIPQSSSAVVVVDPTAATVVVPKTDTGYESPDLV